MPSGYFAGFGPSASCPISRIISALNSGMSFGPTQIDQKSRTKVACTMWNRIEAVSTSPAIQCHVTHANCTPTIGRKEVKSSVNIDAAMIQWNIRAPKPCR